MGDTKPDHSGVLCGCLDDNKSGLCAHTSSFWRSSLFRYAGIAHYFYTSFSGGKLICDLNKLTAHLWCVSLVNNLLRTVLERDRLAEDW
jgi:hypothetical protein